MASVLSDVPLVSDEELTGADDVEPPRSSTDAASSSSSAVSPPSANVDDDFTVSPDSTGCGKIK